MKNKKNNKKDTKKIIDIIVKAVLIIIIIILLLHNCALMKKNNTTRTSTGNVQIIDIKCDNKNTCEPVNPTKPDKPNKPNNGNNQDVYDGVLDVYDNEVEWADAVEANVFANSMYELEGIIAPESSNTYQFVVKNSTEYTLKYNISFIENNPYNVNMKYKLKKNDTYVIDQYVSASELIAQNFILPINSSDTFYLEWKWVSSSNDTQIGSIENSDYHLKIEVKAESING